MFIPYVYMTNTQPGHNKDYLICVDKTNTNVLAIWGGISKGNGGSKTYPHSNLRKIISDKLDKGYSLYYAGPDTLITGSPPFAQISYRDRLAHSKTLLGGGKIDWDKAMQEIMDL